MTLGGVCFRVSNDCRSARPNSTFFYCATSTAGAVAAADVSSVARWYLSTSVAQKEVPLFLVVGFAPADKIHSPSIRLWLCGGVAEGEGQGGVDQSETYSSSIALALCLFPVVTTARKINWQTASIQDDTRGIAARGGVCTSSAVYLQSGILVSFVRFELQYESISTRSCVKTVMFLSVYLYVSLLPTAKHYCGTYTQSPPLHRTLSHKQQYSTYRSTHLLPLACLACVVGCR